MNSSVVTTLLRDSCTMCREKKLSNGYDSMSPQMLSY